MMIFFWQSFALDREQHYIQDFVPSCHVVSFKYTFGNHKHTHLTLLHKPTLIPRFTGFTGKYCFMPRCPLNLTMASSTDKFLPGHSVSTIFNNMIQNGANFVRTKFCIRSWTRYPRFCSTMPCCFFQAYTWKSQTYPLDASAQTHTLIPRFTGFTGKYCFMPRCPLNLTMASSTDKFLPGHSVSTIFNNMIQNGANFEQLVMSWIFLHNLSCVGIQMKVLRQFVKMIFWHAFSTDRTPMSGSLLQ